MDKDDLTTFSRLASQALQRAGRTPQPQPMPQLQSLFCELLRSTRRQGIDRVIDRLTAGGFFEAPASAGFHLNVPGGLALHSYHVCEAACRLRETVLALSPGLESSSLPRESVLIAALLHDVCKTDIYRRNDNKFRKDANGRWETYTGFDTDYTALPAGHGEKSVIMLLRWGLELTDDELLAIRWHMEAWDLPFQSFELKSNLSAATAKAPLVTLIQTADSIASHIIEA